LTPSNVTFKVAGQRSQDAQITGDIEGKYVDFKNGLTVTQVSLRAVVYRAIAIVNPRSCWAVWSGRP